ncbi:formimidoylglutamase [Muriicola sp.]|uniref:formimidoylglutamase n=1 Tax=Muriicola sp. TaxID=2020856 RepID=UPI003C714DD0
MIGTYSQPSPENWTGRTSGKQAYLHEKVILHNALDTSPSIFGEKVFALLGYACDEGVRRNFGRPGAVEGPNAIRSQLGKMSNHLPESNSLIDLGDLHCPDGNMEATQEALDKQIQNILNKNAFPLLLGGGHDIAYGHYRGLRNYLGNQKRLGIINFDAHFDLRKNDNGNHSGTPFYQIAQDAANQNITFDYLCLGIRKDANTSELFDTAKTLGAQYISRADFAIQKLVHVEQNIKTFLSGLDKVYVTIDLDGFSSAYAPGVSAASPLGFSPEIVMASLAVIIRSRKLMSLDLAEMNPAFDRDEQTAKLAAGMLHYCMHELALL